MKVFLKDMWFAPGARRFRKGENEIPDELCARNEDGTFKYLPSNSVIGGKPANKVAPTKPQTLRDLDDARAVSEAVAKKLMASDQTKRQIEPEPEPKPAPEVEQVIDPEEMKAFQQAEADDRAKKSAEFQRQLAEEAKAGAEPEEEEANDEAAPPRRRRK